MNNTETSEKPVQRKCVGFSSKIGKTTYKTSCFLSESATESLETKVKRMIEKDLAS